MEEWKAPVWTCEENSDEGGVKGREQPGVEGRESPNGAARGGARRPLTGFSPVVLVPAVVEHLHAARSPQRVQEDVV